MSCKKVFYKDNKRETIIGGHRWEKVSFSIRISHNYKTTIFNCNDCPSMKVLFEMDDGEVREQIVEPYPSDNG